MYQKIKELYGQKLSASDGLIGHVRDFYFEDVTWTIRYLVADTGSWLPGRQVLLPPNAFGDHFFGKSNTVADLLVVNLTRQQIEDSPPIELHRPVSRQYEEEYYRYHQWPAYWRDGSTTGETDISAARSPASLEAVPRHESNQKDDPHLRSTKATTGYKIQASDGPIGSVSGFMLDGRNWTIREVVVHTGHWYSSKEILLLPENISRMSYEDSTMFINLTKANIQSTMSYDVAQSAGSNR